MPLADGGPGTVEAVVTAAGGRYSHARVEGPLGDPVNARWGRIDDGRTAIIEMAAASGLLLVPPGRLDPRRASTIGTGELIGAALDAGVSRLLVGVGGSATNDGGAGMATALGARFLDDDGRPIAPGGAALAGLARIDVGGLDPRLAAVEVRVLADVRNPLTGPDGASAVYGPQKGADATTIAELDRALTHFADIVARDVGADILTLPGGGAAGGLGAGLIAFTGARIEPGIEAIASAVRLDARLAGADVVLTGEGSLDRQSAFGKTVAGVAAPGRRRGRAVSGGGRSRPRRRRRARDPRPARRGSRGRCGHRRRRGDGPGVRPAGRRQRAPAASLAGFRSGLTSPPAPSPAERWRGGPEGESGRDIREPIKR